MSLIRPQIGVIAAAAFAALLAPLPARADLTLVQTTTIINPQITAALQSMTPQQRAQVQRSGNPFFHSGPQTTTLYVQGKKSRLDYGAYTVIADPGTGRIVTLNRKTHTYSTRPYSAGSGGGIAGATPRDTHQTRRILGHVAHRYIVQTANVAGAGSQLKADVWAAPDLPRPALLDGAGGGQSPAQALLRQVKGLPLQTTVVVAGSPLGTITLKSLAKSVSIAPVAASVFALPPGFKAGNTGSPMGPGFGGGLGQ